MVFNVVTVTFCQAVKEVAGNPELIAGLLCTLCEDLEFPLSASDFLVDSFEIETCFETEICMFFDERTPVCVLTANGTIVQSLRARVATNWETKGKLCIDIHDEVFLFKTKPKVCIIIIDGCSTVAEVRGPIWVQNFTHDKVTVDTLWVREDVDWLEKTVG